MSSTSSGAHFTANNIFIKQQLRDLAQLTETLLQKLESGQIRTRQQLEAVERIRAGENNKCHTWDSTVNTMENRKKPEQKTACCFCCGRKDDTQSIQYERCQTPSVQPSATNAQSSVFCPPDVTQIHPVGCCNRSKPMNPETEIISVGGYMTSESSEGGACSDPKCICKSKQGGSQPEVKVMSLQRSVQVIKSVIKVSKDTAVVVQEIFKKDQVVEIGTIEGNCKAPKLSPEPKAPCKENRAADLPCVQKKESDKYIKPWCDSCPPREKEPIVQSTQSAEPCSCKQPIADSPPAIQKGCLATSLDETGTVICSEPKIDKAMNSPKADNVSKTSSRSSRHRVRQMSKIKERPRKKSGKRHHSKVPTNKASDYYPDYYTWPGKFKQSKSKDKAKVQHNEAPVIKPSDYRPDYYTWPGKFKTPAQTTRQDMSQLQSICNPCVCKLNSYYENCTCSPPPEFDLSGHRILPALNLPCNQNNIGIQYRKQRRPRSVDPYLPTECPKATCSCFQHTVNPAPRCSSNNQPRYIRPNQPHVMNVASDRSIVTTCSESKIHCCANQLPEVVPHCNRQRYTSKKICTCNNDKHLNNVSSDKALCCRGLPQCKKTSHVERDSLPRCPFLLPKQGHSAHCNTNHINSNQSCCRNRPHPNQTCKPRSQSCNKSPRADDAYSKFCRAWNASARSPQTTAKCSQLPCQKDTTTTSSKGYCKRCNKRKYNAALDRNVADIKGRPCLNMSRSHDAKQTGCQRSACHKSSQRNDESRCERASRQATQASPYKPSTCQKRTEEKRKDNQCRFCSSKDNKQSDQQIAHWTDAKAASTLMDPVERKRRCQRSHDADKHSDRCAPRRCYKEDRQ